MAALNKKSVDDINVKGKRVLVRCDFNVPLQDGKITDENRLVAALPTIKKLIADGGKVILCSHLGKPKGEPKPELSLAPVAVRLSELLGQEVKFAADREVVGPNAKAAVEAMKDGDVILLENTRYRAEETKNGDEFSKELASLCDVFVNDAFGTAHRAHCSNVGVTKYVDTAVVGYLMEKEIAFLGNAVENPERPFVAILGGAKVSSKISVINNLLDKVDTLIIGGGMSYTFSKALGGHIGTSLCEDDYLEYALEMLKKAEEMGYIKITVEYPVLSNEELSASLKKKYNLEKVFLVPKLSDAPVAVQEDVCRAAAKDLSSYLNDGSIIGTAWGRTMKSFANYVSDLGVHNVKVVQINGKTNETSVPVGADDLSQAIARAGHGEAYVIPAPVAVDSAEIAEMLKKERNISAALTLARECQIALFGVGNLSRNTILYRSGSLKEEDFIELEEKGAVGDVCTCFFDAQGEAVSSSFAKRRISITLEELKKIPCKIGVASGLEKKEALHAALLGEYINILYADEELGKELIAI